MKKRIFKSSPNLENYKNNQTLFYRGKKESFSFVNHDDNPYKFSFIVFIFRKI